MFRLASFLVLMILANLTPWWLFFIAATVYLYRYEGIEVFLLGIGIDAYYGYYTLVPMYALFTGIMLLFFSYARPYLSV